jgi:hypothetical protein
MTAVDKIPAAKPMIKRHGILVTLVLGSIFYRS